MTQPRRFHLHRTIDVTGVSGTGHVADGVQWPDGSASVRWRGDRPSTVWWASFADVQHVHGHGGNTIIVWDDGEDGYTPPPPGSDRDALPEDLRQLIAPHMRDYVSTACETALALDKASTIHHAALDTLMDWETRQHASCRITRKQDMARCQCDCHTPAGAKQQGGVTNPSPVPITPL